MAILGLPNWSGYGAAKGAILGLTLNLATEAAGTGIGVNAIAPGAGTRMVLDTVGTTPPGAVERMMAALPPKVVSPMAAYLAHDSCTLNGEVFSVAGGQVARVVVAHTPGWSKADLSLEDVAAHVNQIRDVGGLEVWGFQA